jgi:ATP-binding cassette subfamily F protein uup
MNIISVNSISKIIGEKLLFKDITFGINEGEKVAIVGINGSGKSTLLKILLGTETYDSGTVVKNKSLKISALNQNPVYSKEDTILEHIFNSQTPIFKTIRRYEEICVQMESNLDEELQSQFESITAEMDRLNGWDVESKFKSYLNELGVNDTNQKMKELSGGMLKKVELIKTILEESNLIVLDEPTNHLDVNAILWLEKILLQTEKSILLITHDRYFLDRVVNRILEIDQNGFFSYEGNYEYYLQKKVERENLAKLLESKAENTLRKELEWLSRQPKARTTKQKARIDRANDLIERDRYQFDKDLELKVMAKRQGKTILELSNVSKNFGRKKILDNFSYYFKKQERLGIVGPNGAGKSTLLNILCGKILPDSGIVKPGINTEFGYFDQMSRELDNSMRVLEYIKKTGGEFIKIDENTKITASQLLEKFLFPPKVQSTLIEKLSGGEKRRLYLVQILMKNPNFLLLDEPTNDLDIRTLSVLEDFLLEFPGCVVLVSHDRYFMDRVSESLLILENGKIESYIGTYTSYLERKKKSANKKDEKKEETETFVSQTTKKKSFFKEKKEIESLEKEIEKLEKEKETISAEMSASNDYKLVQEKSIRLKELETILESKLMKWEELLQVVED